VGTPEIRAINGVYGQVKDPGLKPDSLITEPSYFKSMPSKTYFLKK